MVALHGGQNSYLVESVGSILFFHGDCFDLFHRIDLAGFLSFDFKHLAKCPLAESADNLEIRCASSFIH